MELQRGIDVLPDPVVVLDDGLRFVTGNIAAQEIFGWTVEEAGDLDVLDLVHPDDVVTALGSAASVRDKDVGSLVEIRLRTRGGSFRTFEVRGRQVDDDELRGLVLVMRDVTDRNRWDVNAGVEALHRAIVNVAPGITLLLDADGRLRGATRALTTLLQRPLDGLLGGHVRDLLSPATVGAVAEALRSSARAGGTVEACLRDRHGNDIPVWLQIVDLRSDASVNGFVVSAVEISELSESRDELAYLANHDPLTGLPNRRRVMEALREILVPGGSVGGLVFCDIEQFKVVNDRHGHGTGDQVLVEVAARLRTATRGDDVVGRIGGDEFVVICPACPEEGLAALRRRIELLMYEPVLVDGQVPITVAVTTGSSSFGPGDTVDRVLGSADWMMYTAKQRVPQASVSR